MFTVAERDAVSTRILDYAANDSRVSGAAVVGSLAFGLEIAGRTST